MVVYKNEQKRILTVWLTNEDQQNTVCMASLQPLIREWSAQKYLPVSSVQAKKIWKRTLQPC